MNLSKLLTLVMGGKSSVLDSLFDQGSSASITAVDATTTRITPVKHFSGAWAWFAVRSSQWAGVAQHFVIAKADHFSMNSGEWLACWATAADTDTWYLFDNVTIGAVDLEFYHDTPFPAGIIYVAAMPMYPFSRTQRKMAAWLANALVTDTASGTDGIVGNDTARDAGDGSGRTCPALPFYGFEITSGAGTKNNGLLTSGNHPSENIGRYMLEGAVDWLLTAGDLRDFLLDYFNFFVYPLLNPQGVWAGYFRSSPETPNSDNNRLWDGTGVNEAVDAFKTAWGDDFETTMEVGLDYHSWMAADGNKGLTNDSTTALWVAYIAAMQALDATFVMRADDATASMSFNYWQSLNANKLTGAPDHGGKTALGVSDWKTVGQRSMQALAKLVAQGYFANNPGVGSRDFNGSTDRIDWAAVANLTGSAVTVSAWVYSDGQAGNADYVLCLHRSGDAAIGLVVAVATATGINFYRAGTTALNVIGTVTSITSGWHNIICTHAGDITAAATVHIYRDGAEAAEYPIATNGAAEYAPTGKWSLGGRVYDDARNFDGKLAQVGVWNRVLTAAEIAALAAGYAPSVAAASGLQFYLKANTDSLVAAPGGEGTADGTNQVTGIGTGPTIYY
jgi:hypothetical protein